MSKKILLSLVGVMVFTGLSLWVITRAPELERALLEKLANRYGQDFLAGPAHIGKAHLDRHLRLHIAEITGALKTRRQDVPLILGSLESLDPLTGFLKNKPVRFRFHGLRPQTSPRGGISGDFTIQAGPDPSLDLTADFGDTALEDWQWLDPQNLDGATGAMKGRLTFRQASGKEPEFSINLEAPQPGGNIQARFFDLFLPYLPTASQKEKVTKVSQNNKLVRYQTASLEASLPQSDHLKILLRIFIPDYNLKLTLNADIRTDAKDAFSQIARIMGLVEVK